MNTTSVVKEIKAQLALWTLKLEGPWLEEEANKMFFWHDEVKGI